MARGPFRSDIQSLKGRSQIKKTRPRVVTSLEAGQWDPGDYEHMVYRAHRYCQFNYLNLESNGGSVVDQFVASLHLPIPAVRLAKYRQSPESNLHMLTNYFWNMALSESLYPTLHGVELALRNTIHATLTNRYGTEEWWDRPHTLHRYQRDEVDKKRQRYFKKYGVPISPGHLVAELTFGFWVIVLSGTHVSNIWRWKRFLLVDQAFPYRGSNDLSVLYTRFNEIRGLRNRVMHYERIFDRPDLRRDHADIHEAIQWISPDLHAGIHAVDRFLDIHQYGWDRAYRHLHGMLGGP